MQSNRLAAETSPYLRQHATNPVDWYPWGEEALERARRENKPILLSIGYSACHWCHVMAHESFDDADTAALMNRLFVNIKVDREERPDLDKIYQIAQQLITQRSGGWPLTMFLTPDDRQPFFGGTYFPKTAGRGMPAFRDILQRVADYFSGHAEEVRQQNVQLGHAFDRLTHGLVPPDTVLDADALTEARAALEKSFDAEYGGFGRAPKFPHANSIERALRHWYSTAHATAPDLKALYIATLTLTRMAEGGIYDQLGGGFSRYSVDDFWMIPHFEKMLYDNGQLLFLYAQATLATREPLFARIAAETADWLLRDMRSAAGGFYSSLDADSEGHEGRFYVWSPAQVEAELTAAEFAVFAPRFGLDRPANFEGAWNLHAYVAEEAIAPPPGGSVAEALGTARAALLAVRSRRVWPARDEKVLTAWNALTIKGLAAAGRVLGRSDLIDAAVAAVDFIHRHLWREGRLLASFKDGRAHLPAYLDDHAFLLDALLELLQARWRSRDLEFAQELAELLLERFEDRERGGFHFTASDHEHLIHRPKSFEDESVPSGNGVAAAALCRLGYLLGDTRYLAAAEHTLQGASRAMRDHPLSHMSLLNALEDFMSSTQILILRGSAEELGPWLRQLAPLYAPTRMTFAIPLDAVLPPSLDAKRAGPGPTAYLCTGMTCSAPITNLQLLLLGLHERRMS